MKKVAVFLLSIMIVFLVGCGNSFSPVIDAITSDIETGDVQYWTIYNNDKAEKTGEFEPEKAEVINVPDNDFLAEIVGNKISVSVNEYEIEDEYGSSYEADGNLRRIIDDVAENADHDIFGVKILNVDGNIFVFEKHNVNWQLPCVLYQYFPDTRELSKLYQWDGVELVGLGNIRIADEDDDGDNPLPVTDVFDCKTFEDIVNKKLKSNMGYTYTKIGEEDTLIVSWGPYEKAGKMVSDDYVIFIYKDGKPTEISRCVNGDADIKVEPIAVKDGYFYTADNYDVVKETIVDGNLTVVDEATIEDSGYDMLRKEYNEAEWLVYNVK